MILHIILNFETIQYKYSLPLFLKTDWLSKSAEQLKSRLDDLLSSLDFWNLTSGLCCVRIILPHLSRITWFSVYHCLASRYWVHPCTYSWLGIWCQTEKLSTSQNYALIILYSLINSLIIQAKSNFCHLSSGTFCLLYTHSYTHFSPALSEKCTLQPFLQCLLCAMYWLGTGDKEVKKVFFFPESANE